MKHFKTLVLIALFGSLCLIGYSQKSNEDENSLRPLPPSTEFDVVTVRSSTLKLISRVFAMSE